MRIIHRLPFFDHETSVDSPSGPQDVVAYQIVLSAALNIRGVFSRPFPAILDTGHSHNFSISERHLLAWTGTRVSELRAIGHITMGSRLVVLRRAEIGLVPNRAGTTESHGEVVLLHAPAGIAVFEGDFPRLPLLGLRALTRSGLKTVIDGKRMQVSIGRGWFG